MPLFLPLVLPRTREIGGLIPCLFSSSLDVRLAGGRIDSEGRVEFRSGDTWGTVCDDGWDDNDANVICTQLGYFGKPLSFLYNAEMPFHLAICTYN